MVTIEVLVSGEEAKQKLGQRYSIKAHRRISKAIDAIADQKWSEYIASSDAIEAHRNIGGVPSPIDLPKKLYERIYASNGEGFEIPLLFQLFALENSWHSSGKKKIKFGYEEGTIYPPNKDSYDGSQKLSTLVNRIKQRIGLYEKWFFGATITPVLYTISEKHIYDTSREPKLLPQEIKEAEKEVSEVLEHSDLNFIQKIIAKFLVKTIGHPKDINGEICYRSLTEEERKEFERLFNKQ